MSIGEPEIDSEDARRRRLLLERLGQVAIPCLELPEQPHVFDGDHGLVGEGLYQLDLFVGEGLDPRPPDHDHSDDGRFPEHRHGEDCADLVASLTRGPTVFGVRQDIRDVNGAAFENCPSGRGLSTWRDRVRLGDLKELWGRARNRPPPDRGPRPAGR